MSRIKGKYSVAKAFSPILKDQVQTGTHLTKNIVKQHPFSKQRQSGHIVTASQKFSISCLKSRIETNRCFYGCFYLGPFDPGQSLTVANSLRRTLLSELKGLAITSVEIEGALHEYSNLPGVRDSILDILLNLKEIILKKKKYLKFVKTQVGYLRVQGPGVITAADLQLPPFIQCVDPSQYIATLADDGYLNMKFCINEGKNYHIQTYKNLTNPQTNASDFSAPADSTKNQQFSTGFPVKASLPMKKEMQSVAVKTSSKIFKKLKKTGLHKPRVMPSRLKFIEPNAIGMKSLKKKYFSFWKKGLQTNPEFFLSRTSSGDTLYKSRKGIIKFLLNPYSTMNSFKPYPSKVSSSMPLLIDPVFMPILKVNYIIESHELANDLLADQNQAFENNDGLYKPEENFLNSTKKEENEQTPLKNSENLPKRLNKINSKKHVTNKKVKNVVTEHPLDQHLELKKRNLRKKSKITFLGGSVQSNNTNSVKNTDITPTTNYSSLSLLQKQTRQTNSFMIQNIKTAQTKIDPKQNVRLEIWTNGSIHPREALYTALKKLLSVFGRLKTVKYMNSMYKSEKTYKTYFNGKTIRKSPQKH